MEESSCEMVLYGAFDDEILKYLIGDSRGRASYRELFVVVIEYLWRLVDGVAGTLLERDRVGEAWDAQ